MNNQVFQKKKFIVYLISTFVIAYAIQFAASIFLKNGNASVSQILLILVMYAPFAGVLISRAKLGGMGWIPHLKGKVRYVLSAMLLPGVLACFGAVIYFAIFPSAFDLTGTYMIAVQGEDVIKQLEAQGLTLQMYNAVTIVMCFTMGPLINMFAALGEEVGWRGFMYPQLKAVLGKNKGCFVGGIIWGAWHFPLMFLVGYEYGTDYFGWPFLGPVVFCVFTIAAGIFVDFLYEKTHIIWIPALAHGAMNAATFPLLFMNVDYANQAILGPVFNGAISGIPLAVTAVIICVKQAKKKA